MLDIQFRYRFEAAHRFMLSQSKCSTPHGHTWFVVLTLRSKMKDLSSQGMTTDFSELKKEWKLFVDETLDHSFFHHFKDPVAGFLKDHIEKPRLLAFPSDPTTELFSALCFHKATRLFEDSDFEVQEVLIEETPTNKVRCSREAYQQICKQFRLTDANAWWNHSDAEDRSFRH